MPGKNKKQKRKQKKASSSSDPEVPASSVHEISYADDVISSEEAEVKNDDGGAPAAAGKKQTLEENVFQFTGGEVLMMSLFEQYSQVITSRNPQKIDLLLKMATCHGTALPSRPKSVESVVGWKKHHVLAGYLVGKIFMLDDATWINTPSRRAANARAAVKMWEYAAEQGKIPSSLVSFARPVEGC